MHCFRGIYILRMSTCILLLGLGCTRSQMPTEDLSMSAHSMSGGFVIPIDLGVLHKGESREFRCWIENKTSSSLKIDRFESSCDCITLCLGDPPAGQAAHQLLTVRYDGEGDPEFVGSLRITAVAFGKRGSELGRVTIAVEVVPDERSGYRSSEGF
jgi:hypothetical protein